MPRGRAVAKTRVGLWCKKVRWLQLARLVHSSERRAAALISTTGAAPRRLQTHDRSKRDRRLHETDDSSRFIIAGGTVTEEGWETTAAGFTTAHVVRSTPRIRLTLGFPPGPASPSRMERGTTADIHPPTARFAVPHTSRRRALLRLIHHRASPVPTSVPPLSALIVTVLSVGPPVLPDDTPGSKSAPEPVTEGGSAQADPPERSPPTSRDASDFEMPVTVDTGEAQRRVDLVDESTWEGLSPSQRDRLRVERARRESGTEPLAPPAPVPPDAARVRKPGLDAGTFARRQSELKLYYETKERRLITATAAFGGVWGVLTLTTLIAAGTGTRSPGLYGVLGLGTGVTGLGTVVSGTMLGAHRNTRPLYFAASPGGLTMRF